MDCCINIFAVSTVDSGTLQRMQLSMTKPEMGALVAPQPTPCDQEPLSISGPQRDAINHCRLLKETLWKVQRVRWPGTGGASGAPP